jgi:hypothetical protein
VADFLMDFKGEKGLQMRWNGRIGAHADPGFAAPRCRPMGSRQAAARAWARR